MNDLTLGNPVFAAYAVAVALTVLKVMGQGWMTVARMMKVRAGFASPEDARVGAINPAPRDGQVGPDDYVDRSRRMHRNDLENIPAFWAVGLVFTASSPPSPLAYACFAAFVCARAAHAVVYARAMSHEIRATFYTIGSLTVVLMAFWTIGAAVL